MAEEGTTRGAEWQENGGTTTEKEKTTKLEAATALLIHLARLFSYVLG
jgi:hypothetical protein